MKPFPHFFPDKDPHQEDSLSNPVVFERNMLQIRQFLKGMFEACPGWAYFYAFHAIIRLMKHLDMMEISKIDNLNDAYNKGYQLGNTLFAQVEP